MGVVVKGFVAGGHPQARSRDEDGRFITAHSPPLLLHTKKIQFVGFRFSYIISQCGNFGSYHLCVFRMKSTFEKGRNEFLKKPAVVSEIYF